MERFAMQFDYLVALPQALASAPGQGDGRCDLGYLDLAYGPDAGELAVVAEVLSHKTATA